MVWERHETAEEKDAAGGEDGRQECWLRVAIPGRTVDRQNCGPIYNDHRRPPTHVGETVLHHQSTYQPLQGQLLLAGSEGRVTPLVKTDMTADDCVHA